MGATPVIDLSSLPKPHVATVRGEPMSSRGELPGDGDSLVADHERAPISEPATQLGHEQGSPIASADVSPDDNGRANGDQPTIAGRVRTWAQRHVVVVLVAFALV